MPSRVNNGVHEREIFKVKVNWLVWAGQGLVIQSRVNLKCNRRLAALGRPTMQSDSEKCLVLFFTSRRLVSYEDQSGNGIF